MTQGADIPYPAMVNYTYIKNRISGAGFPVTFSMTLRALDLEFGIGKTFAGLD